MIHFMLLLACLLIGLVMLSLAPGGTPWPRLVMGELLLLGVEVCYRAACLAIVIWYSAAKLGIWFWYHGLILRAQTRWTIYRLRTGLYLWYLIARLTFAIAWQQRRQAR